MKELPHYINTAGKITVITALLGVVAFAVVFLLNIGAKELHQAEAQGFATTTVTVLNTPPQWTVNARELVESSTTTPTNSGSAVTWVAVGTDSNAEDYYLLICSNGNAPTAGILSAPTCGAGAIQWAVSALTTSGATSTAATTTTEAFAESNDWFAWICDAIAENPRCNAASRQGSYPYASPFNVNHRPTFTAFWDDSNAVDSVPGVTVTFYATSSDSDVVDEADTVMLIVCSSASFDTVTDECDDTTIATSTLTASDPTAQFVIEIPTQDQDYAAHGFIVDNHGHEATGATQGSNSVLTVANAAPTVSAATITLNGGLDIELTEEAGETTGFTLEYIATDNNSCENAASTAEIVDYAVSVFRSGVGTTSCDAAGEYDPNDCYTSTVATTTWNVSCSPSVAPGDCGGPTDTTQTWSCTFPLWYIADPTDGSATNTVYHAEDWRAGVSAVDDDAAASSFTQSSTAGIEVMSFLSMALNTFQIPYGQLEPGQRTDPLTASTTILATGNVGLDELLSGESMCTYYTNSVTCNNSATSTIAESNQVFHTASVSYGTATSAGNILSSTSQALLDLNVPKTKATTTPEEGVTYWGINVPITITLAGAYTGENTFYGAVSDPGQW